MLTAEQTAQLGKMFDERLEAKLAPLRETQKSWMDRMLAGPDPAARPREKGLTFARTVLALAAFKGQQGPAIDYATKSWGKDDPVVKALAAADFGAGGAWVRDDYAADFIELLDAAIVVTAFGPIIVRSDVPTHWSKTTAGTTAAYVAENANLTVSEMQTGEVVATPHQIGAICPISNVLLRQTGGNADVIVRNELTKRVGLRSDLAFIRGNGLQDTPKGLRYWAPTGATHTIAATQVGASATLAEVTTDLNKAYLSLAGGNVPLANCGWIMSPRSMVYLRSLRDGNGNLAFADEMGRGTLLGYPWRITTQIPDNLGGGTESEVYLVDFGEVIVQTSPSVGIDASTEASYVDQAGTTHSAFQKNQTLVRIITSNDLVVRHDLAIAVLTTVKWGA